MVVAAQATGLYKCFFLMYQEGLRLFLYMMQGPEIHYLRGAGGSQCRRHSSHESQVNRKKILGIPLWLAQALMTTVTKQPEGGRGLDVKDIHPVNRASSLKLKELPERLSSLLALWWALTQCGTLKAQKRQRGSELQPCKTIKIE